MDFCSVLDSCSWYATDFTCIKISLLQTKTIEILG